MSRPDFAVVVLAAGFSSRFGSPKQIAIYRGKPLLAWAVDNAVESGAAQVIAVVNHEFSSLGLDLPANVEVIVNANPGIGLGSSLAKGIRSVRLNLDIAVVVLGDQPMVPPGHLQNLVDAIGGKFTMAGSAYDDGSIGVPAAFDRVVFDRLMNLTGERGAKALLKEARADCSRVRLTEAGQIDIDTFNDITLRIV